MPILSISIIILIISLIICLALKIRKEKYINFLNNNSIALKQLLEINKKYYFYSNNNDFYDKQKTYDNKDYYNMVSCQDYLIYQLQFIGQDVLTEIKKIETNKNSYNKYCKEVNSINSFGKYSFEKLNYNYLLSIEKELFEDKKLSPNLDFEITVTLDCAKMNGYVYDSKFENFDSNQVLSLIKRLHNKNGNFYNDKEIWDSLCRVERAEVSNELRFYILERDGHRCQKCGISDKFENLEIDHIKPISKGGKSTPDNLQTLCHQCNKEKGNSY